MTQITLRSSYADITVEKETGAVVKIDYGAMGGTDEFDDVDRFDPATIAHVEDEDDVLAAGFWLKDGAYIEPEPDYAHGDA